MGIFSIFQKRANRTVLVKCAADRNGSVLIITALVFALFIAVTGMGIDLGRQQLVKIKVQQATDAAAQAALLSPTGQEAIATTYFNMNYPVSYMGVARPIPAIAITPTSVSVTASVTVPTVFMQFGGIEATASSAATTLPVSVKPVTSTLYCWGLNFYGAGGDGTQHGGSNKPKAVILPAGVKSFPTLVVGGGSADSCGIADTGAAYCWGQNTNGNGGDGGTAETDVPTPVSMPSGVTFSRFARSGNYAYGYNHNCAIGSDGMAYCWGYNQYGELGDGTTTERHVPTPVTLPSGVTSFTSIAVGDKHSCAIGNDKQVYCWGDVQYGKLGVGTAIVYAYPTPLIATPIPVTMPSGVAGFTMLSADALTTCALGDDGAVYCWGFNMYGTVGDGNSYWTTGAWLAATPTKTLLPPINVVSLSVGGNYACALSDTGQAYCWGRNRYGVMGNGSTGDGSDSHNQPVPLLVTLPTGVSKFKSISAGYEHMCAVGDNGTTYCWGDNIFGELGNDDTGNWNNNPLPVAVNLPTGISAYSNVVAGTYLSCGQVGPSAN